ncbi:hypothetical protein [Thalassobacillus hwangdonensis]|uniref:Polymer-forming cytoskeletal protein n=1 Tax=Thalassobacillus hwangdonensis TaxID=546108 RepID=A0ABW3KYF5_9BACI
MANPQLNNEKGYALLVVLLVISLISILGLGLMGLTVNSMNFVNANKNLLESKTVAEQEVDETMAKIQEEIGDLNSNLDRGVADIDFVINQIDALLNNLETSLANGQRLERRLINDGSEGVYLERVDLFIPLEDSSRSLVHTFTFSTIADVFRYSAVSPGNMYLNGAPYINGDMYVGGNLRLDNYAEYIYGGYEREKTSWPAIEGDLTVKDNYEYLYIWLLNWYREFDPVPFNLEKYFSVIPNISEEEPAITPINVIEHINGKNYDLDPYDQFNSKQVGTYNNKNKNTVINSDMKYRELRVKGNGSLTIKGDLVVEDSLTMEQGSYLAVEGSIQVKGSADLSGTLRIKKENHLYIENNADIENLDMEGKMYINGRVLIENELNTNSTIYVRNGGEIRNLSNNVNGGTLVVISDDSLQVSNNNLYNPEPKVMDAYLYTNSELEMFGVGSNIQINGGLYGDPVILNAVKGDTREGYRDLIFESDQDSIPPEKSRLSIYYKDDLILNPPDGIPTVEKVTLKELDSQFVE